MSIYQKAFEAGTKLVGEFLDDQPDLVDTPGRFATAFEHAISGYREDPAEVLKVFKVPQADGMIVQGSIPFFSTCEHHLAPFFGIAHFGYIPNHESIDGDWCARVVGLSKIPRLVDIFARRLTVQERLTNQIVDAFKEYVKPAGCGCVIRARHLCVEARGVAKVGTNTTTSALRGVFFDDADVRREFLSFVATADAGARPI